MTKKYTVAINTLSSRQGGGQVYISNLLRYAQRYPEIKTYALASPEYAGLYNHPAVELISCKVPAQNVLKRTLWERNSLPVILEKLRTDLVFCPGGTINFTPPKGCKTAVTFQNMLIFDKDNKRKYPIGYIRFRLAMLEKISRRSFREANLVIFLSQYAKKVIDQQLPDRKGLSIVIPHGLEERFRTSNKKDIPRSQLLPDGPYLLYVSVINTFKAHLEVVWAYHILCQQRHTPEKLLFVGPSYKSYEKKLRREIKRLNLEDKVKIIGEIPNSKMPSVYHYAKAHIFASTCETFGITVLESLGSGRPLFLSKIQPMPEIAQDAGIYFNPNEPQELADLLLQYLDNEQLMEKMGRKAAERSANFRWSKTAHQTFQAFGNLFVERTKMPKRQKEYLLI
jgi:glycosyltransferase involved in cell wall biosynthesis